MKFILFSASWCCKCQSLKRELEKHSDMKITKYDVDECSNEMLDKYDVNELPLLIAIKNDKEVARYDERGGNLDSWLKFIEW